MNSNVSSTADRLPQVLSRLQQLSSEDLAVVERVLLQLEINQTVAELDELSDDLRTSGMMARLPEIIRAVREDLQRARA